MEEVNPQQLQQILFLWESEARVLKGEPVPEEEQDKPVKLEFPNEGGIRIYLQKVKPETDYKEPMTSFPSPTGILINAYVKKLLPMSLKKFAKANIFKKILYLILSNDMSSLILEYDEWLTAHYLLVPRHLSHAIKELYRAMSGAGIDRVRNLICFHLEYDLAYKYRAQDVLVLLNRWIFYAKREPIVKSLIRLAFKRKFPAPVEELKRVMNILIERENEKSMKDKFGNIINFLCLYLVLRPKTIEKIKEVIVKIDFEKVKLLKEEIYWTNFRYPDYNFRGMTQKEREEDNIKRYGTII